MAQRQVMLDEYIIEQAEARGFASPNRFIHHLMKFEESKIDEVSNDIRIELREAKKTFQHQSEELRNLVNCIKAMMSKYDIDLHITDSQRNFLEQMMKLDKISLDDIENEAWEKSHGSD